VFKIRESLDRGDIIASREVSIRDDETAGALLQRLSYEGADVLKEVVAAVAHEPSRLTFTAQEECRASYARKLKKNDGLIEWNMPARDIYNRIRGLSPWPGACTYLDGRYVKLWEARVVQGRDGASSPAAGTIIEASHKEGILVKTGAGYLAVTRVQPQARKIMTASQFISGYALRAGMRFSSP
jgi:methionyl-tRNA formyltransferase